jgi:hypothetical protein
VVKVFRLNHKGLKGCHEGSQRTFSIAPIFLNTPQPPEKGLNLYHIISSILGIVSPSGKMPLQRQRGFPTLLTIVNNVCLYQVYNIETIFIVISYPYIKFDLSGER